MLGLAERKTSRFGKDLGVDDLYDQLDTLRGIVRVNWLEPPGEVP